MGGAGSLKKSGPHYRRNGSGGVYRYFALSDAQVIWLRKEAPRIGIGKAAKELGVAYTTAWNALKGWTYRHLNDIVKPVR